MLLGTSSCIFGQAAPTATTPASVYNPGPTLPLIDGNFQYSLTASEIGQFGNNGSQGTNSPSNRSSITSFSGNLEYLSRSTAHPFSMLYSGGVLFSTYSQQGASTFQTLTASQGLVRGRWAMGISDSLAYLPQSATTGLSGIPGLGDLAFQTFPDPGGPGQTILTNYGQRINNTVSGNVERQLTGRTSLTGSGTYGILRFLDGFGYSSDQISGQAGISHRLDRRSSVSLNAQYSTYSFGGTSISFQSRGLNVGYSRLLTKDLSFDGSVGPQWTNSFQSLAPSASAATAITVPSRLSVAANVGLGYTHGHAGASIGYSRGVNAGSGVQFGSVSDSVAAQVQRSWGRSWTAAVTGSYSRTSGLVQTGNTSSIYAGAQVSRRFATNFSGYLSYSAVEQSIPASLLNQNAFNGLSQSVGVGITFAPRRARLGQY
jgi:hypothetical protein